MLYKSSVFTNAVYFPCLGWISPLSSFLRYLENYFLLDKAVSSFYDRLIVTTPMVPKTMSLSYY